MSIMKTTCQHIGWLILLLMLNMGCSGKGEASPPQAASSVTDIYAAGYEFNGTQNVAKLWINGVPLILTDGSKNAFLRGVFVSGSDIYAIGREFNGAHWVAKLWKNGIPKSLTNGSSIVDPVFETGI